MKNGMWSKIVWAALGIAALLLVAGCSTGAGQKVPEVREGADFSEITEIAVKAKDTRVCDKIENCLFAKACVSEVAVEKRDAATCGRIKGCEILDESGVDEFAQESCRSDVELAKIGDVSLKGGPEACLKISGTLERYGNEIQKRTVCLMRSAANTSDYRVCEMIEGDVESRDMCLFGYIDEKNPENRELCNKIADEQTKGICLSQFSG